MFGDDIDERQSPSPPVQQQPPRRHSVVSRVEEFPIKLSSIHQSASESSIPKASITTPKQHVRTVSQSSKLTFPCLHILFMNNSLVSEVVS